MNKQAYTYIFAIIVLFAILYIINYILECNKTKNKKYECDKCVMCENKQIEKFENTIEPIVSQHPVEFTKQKYPYYENAALTAPKSSNNMMFGEAKKYNLIKDKTPKTLIQISANLYVIDGNVYEDGKENPPQSYQAFFIDPTSNVYVQIGELKLDGDGIYKLNIESFDYDKINTYKTIVIQHVLGDTKNIILQGKF